MTCQKKEDLKRDCCIILMSFTSIILYTYHYTNLGNIYYANGKGSSDCCVIDRYCLVSIRFLSGQLIIIILCSRFKFFVCLFVFVVSLCILYCSWSGEKKLHNMANMFKYYSNLFLLAVHYTNQYMSYLVAIADCSHADNSTIPHIAVVVFSRRYWNKQEPLVTETNWALIYRNKQSP